jgi:hypothetical protein
MLRKQMWRTNAPMPIGLKKEAKILLAIDDGGVTLLIRDPCVAGVGPAISFDRFAHARLTAKIEVQQDFGDLFVVMTAI